MEGRKKIYTLWKIRDSLNHIAFEAVDCAQQFRRTFRHRTNIKMAWVGAWGLLVNLIGIRVTVFDARIFMSSNAFFFYIHSVIAWLVCHGAGVNIQLACCARSEHLLPSHRTLYILLEILHFVVAWASVSKWRSSFRWHRVQFHKHCGSTQIHLLAIKQHHVQRTPDFIPAPTLCVVRICDTFFVHLPFVSSTPCRTDCANVSQHQQENKRSQ